MGTAFSIIIPTCGRPSLSRTLQSIMVAGIKPQDEVLVITDGVQPKAKEICNTFVKLPLRFIEGPVDKCWGHGLRNIAMPMATKTHLAFMDDDDGYMPDSLAKIRTYADKNPDKILMLQLWYDKWKRVLGKEKKIQCGCVSGQMIVVPCIPDRLGHWDRVYEGDFRFIRSTVAKWPGGENGIIWIPEVLTWYRNPASPRLK